MELNEVLFSMRSDLATFSTSIFGWATVTRVRLAVAINLCKGRGFRPIFMMAVS